MLILSIFFFCVCRSSPHTKREQNENNLNLFYSVLFIFIVINAMRRRIAMITFCIYFLFYFILWTSVHWHYNQHSFQRNHRMKWFCLLKQSIEFKWNGIQLSLLRIKRKWCMKIVVASHTLCVNFKMLGKGKTLGLNITPEKKNAFKSLNLDYGRRRPANDFHTNLHLNINIFFHFFCYLRSSPFSLQCCW